MSESFALAVGLGRRVRRQVASFLATALLVAPAMAQAPDPDRYQGILFDSAVLNAQREIYVHLPPSYFETDRRYPVLYLLDGEEVFSRRWFSPADRWLASSDSWNADLVADAHQGLGEVILVAVAAGLRGREYIPFAADQNDGITTSESYLDFLIDDLKPHIDANFRTLLAPDTTGIVGSSFGGLFSLYAGLERPDIFGFFAALSPSLWVADREALARIAASEPGGTRAYVDIGTLEGGEEMMELARRAATLLEGKGHPTRFVIGERHTHSKSAWEARFPEVLAWFFVAR